MSPFYSLELCIQRGISFLVPLPFTSFLFSAICKASSDNHFAFLFLGDGFDYHLLYNVKNFRPWFFRHSLLDLILWIYFSLPLYNHKRFDLGHTWMVLPTFFNLHMNLAIRSSWSELQSAPNLIFADCIELLQFWLQRIQSIWFLYWPSSDVHV